MDDDAKYDAQRLDALLALLHSGLAVVHAGGAEGATDAQVMLMDASAQDALKAAQITNTSLQAQLDEARHAADIASRQSATLMNALAAELSRARTECAAHQREIAALRAAA